MHKAREERKSKTHISPGRRAEGRREKVSDPHFGARCAKMEARGGGGGGGEKGKNAGKLMEGADSQTPSSQQNFVGQNSTSLARYNWQETHGLP